MSSRRTSIEATLAGVGAGRAGAVFLLGLSLGFSIFALDAEVVLAILQPQWRELASGGWCMSYRVRSGAASK